MDDQRDLRLHRRPTPEDARRLAELAGAVRCLVELRADLLAHPEFGEDLQAFAVELRPRGPAWDGAARLAAWGYLCAFAADHINGDFGTVVQLAEIGMPLEPATADQLVSIGPLASEQPELFQTRLTRLIVREARGPDDLSGALRLLDTAWPQAWTDGWHGERAPDPLPMPLQGLISRPALARIDKLAASGHEGAQRLATYYVGQAVGLMNTEQSARSVVYDFMKDYAEAAERLAGTLED